MSVPVFVYMCSCCMTKYSGVSLSVTKCLLWSVGACLTRLQKRVCACLTYANICQCCTHLEILISADKCVNKASVCKYMKFVCMPVNSWRCLALAFFHSFILFAAFKNAGLRVCVCFNVYVHVMFFRVCGW